MIEKTCTGPCRRVLPATREYFTRDARRQDGLVNECNVCRNRRARANHEKRMHRSGIVETRKDDTTRRCPVCHHSYPATTEYFYADHPSRGGNRLTSICRKCDNNRRHKASAEKCGACDATNGNLRGDIEMSTGTRYGLLCAKCFTLVSAAKGDSERVSQVARYLKKTRNVVTNISKGEM